VVGGDVGEQGGAGFHERHPQKILLAIEFGTSPRQLRDMPPGYMVFKRVRVPEIMRAFDDNTSLLARTFARHKFQQAIDHSMGYWEKLIPADEECFVHYAIGKESDINSAFTRLKKEAADLKLLGTYHVEPQSSAYPFGFPVNPVPNHWDLGHP